MDKSYHIYIKSNSNKLKDLKNEILFKYKGEIYLI
jgi:hypothetical protein